MVTETAAGPRRALVIVGIVLAALNLRAAVTSLGAVLDVVRASLGMSAALAGAVTALPVLCFAVVGAVTPALGRRIGERSVVVLGLAAIAIGLGGRAVATGPGVFLIGSVLALVGIAVANIVVPVVVKHVFPDRVGVVMGLYSMSAALGVALPVSATVAIGQVSGWGWRGGLGAWALLAGLALVPWIMLLRTRPSGHADVASSTPLSVTALLRNHVALSLTAFFGLQALHAYVLMGWLPTILTGSAGLGSQTAGALIGMSAIVAIPISLAMPRLATRTDDQRSYVLVIVAGGLAGYLGLLFAPAAAPLLWVLLLASLHGTFPLAVTLIAVRTREAATATRLSGLVQSGGYLLAALGPLGMGTLHGLTGTWQVPIVVLVGTLLLQLAAGLAAARPGTVEGLPPKTSVAARAPVQ